MKKFELYLGGRRLLGDFQVRIFRESSWILPVDQSAAVVINKPFGLFPPSTEERIENRLAQTWLNHFYRRVKTGTRNDCHDVWLLLLEQMFAILI